MLSELKTKITEKWLNHILDIFNNFNSKVILGLINKFNLKILTIGLVIR